MEPLGCKRRSQADLIVDLYKNLNLTEIENYLKKEQPFNCIGSIKSEGLGITLLDEINSSDPTAVIGLPLIALVDMLKKIGININDS